MIKSMTGFGRSEYSSEKKSITVEIKSVNHRYCDINIRMPRSFAFAEEKLKAEIKKHIFRGKVEVFITVDNFAEVQNDICLNEEIAEKYYNAFKKISEKFSLSNNNKITVDMIAGMPDVIKQVPKPEDENEILKMLIKPFTEAVDELITMRKNEGRKLADDILMRCDILSEIRKNIENRAPMIQKEYVEKLKERIKELLDDTAEISEDRIALEAAIFADKANITEELVRLDSHITQLRSLVNSQIDAVGKKMDFLVQEMNREANTIGSKANDSEITSYMLDLKAEIEKIREQVQNIE